MLVLMIEIMALGVFFRFTEGFETVLHYLLFAYTFEFEEVQLNAA